MTTRLPALFLGHGSPMTMVTDNPERRALSRLGEHLLAALPPPRAVLAISAHWQTKGRTHITTGPAPRTIHDYYGFPDELYRIAYPAAGAGWLEDRIASLLGADRVARDAEWGFDHGSFGVLLPLFGKPPFPTVAMSLDRALGPDDFLALGAALAPLRKEGVLIVGSGNIVHNLAEYRQTIGTVPPWARAFQDRINTALIADNHAALTRFAPDDEAAHLAINSAEHYLPLLAIVGARLPGDGAAVFNDSVSGSLSMTSVVIGDVTLAEGI